ncbi:MULTISPECIES: serine--tRNA ligase [unclassified Paenibacillus]|uniref:serine--tRNA ligase n=1 Tax=unclassified Paenibacillus TaxID=185978 RepID=UPI000956A503|nr:MULTISPECIES: serine--tRNA ligase [unclassified Paenibacillus]ASS68113.1 serine--tRNA ligase [Paenibacillus sp. RUD330]SIR68420.1 seryl-tRNA synthetase [Paenibacillus sp. RU4X]SIR75968.1 seryl-tRNA synthetase [Paenibacillus sp. RU4T]
MLEMGWIRENPEEVRKAAAAKGLAFNVEELLAADALRRKLQGQADELRQARNLASAQVAAHMRAKLPAEAEKSKRQAREANERLLEVEPALADAESEYRRLMLEAPNPVSEDTPAGQSDLDNVQVEAWGQPPQFGFMPLSHVELGELHGLVDFGRGVKTGGSRSYYLKGAGALLHRAVQQLALDVLLREGFTLLEVPVMVRTEAFTSTGFFPSGEDQAYRLEGRDERLAGTAEVPLVNYYSGEIIDVSEPLRLAAVSACFRSEAGSAGRDTHGLYRVHQFAKVEQVVICRADREEAERLHREITGHARKVLELLELPYRVMAVCAGDMSQKTHKQFDLEAWMPSRDAYGETHSSSSLLDFQARRAGIRYRDDEGMLRHCFTLNNTAAASPRILIPLLEIHQREDGSIRIPDALRPYMNGLSEIRT